MKSLSISRCAGITLLELMIVIAVLGILAAIAVPNLRQVINNNRVAAQSNELVTLLHLARSQAVRLDSLVEVRLGSNDGGWSGEVFVRECDDEDDCDPDPDCPAVEGFVRCVAGTGLTLRSPNEIIFNNRGYLSDEGSDFAPQQVMCLEHLSCQGSSQHRVIRALSTGQIQTESLACGAVCAFPSP